MKHVARLSADCLVALRTAMDIAPQESQAAIGAPDNSASVYRSNPRQVFGGDTHLHLSFSTDAGLTRTRLGLDETLLIHQERDHMSPIWRRL